MMEEDVSVPPGTIETPGFGRTQFRERKQRSIVPSASGTGYLLKPLTHTSYWATFTESLRDKSPHRTILALMLTRMGSCRILLGSKPIYLPNGQTKQLVALDHKAQSPSY